VIVIGLYYFLMSNNVDPCERREVEIGLWYFPIAMFLIVGGSNAMNFTDGLDGLAGLIATGLWLWERSHFQQQIFLARFCLRSLAQPSASCGLTSIRQN
jgi:UDP-N-acetylmuramyl pentapeptide phosphotransferase/UDP-N-acetylglucosamine-1-phosphate transferase